MTSNVVPANSSRPLRLWMIFWTATAALLAAAPCGSGQEAAPKQQPAGAAVALVVSDSLKQLGCAFCVHKEGLFATTDGIARSAEELYLVLEAGTQRERKIRAKVFHSDADSGLALLMTDQPNEALTLADDGALLDAAAFLAAGFRMAPGGFVNEYPTLEVTNCRLASPKEGRGASSEIQLKSALDPGVSGGPLLNGQGHVVAVLRSGGDSQGATVAIPVSKLATLIERPQIEFTPPELQASRIHELTRFTVEVKGRSFSARPQLELRLISGDGSERRFPLGSGLGTRSIDVIPSPRAIDVLIRSLDGSITGQVLDQTFRIGAIEYRLGSRDLFKFDNMAGQIAPGQQQKPIEGLQSVAVQLGAAQTVVDLSKADEIRLRPREMRYEGLTLNYAIIASVGEREVARLSGPIAIADLPSTDENAALVDCHLPAPIRDLSVGGRGRWIILHIPALRKLAVFDVLARQIVHHVPLAEERVAFAAGLSKLVVVFPDAGVIQRWDLKTGRREATSRLSISGRVTLVAMGSGADGPVLIHWLQSGARAASRWSLVDADTFKASPLELALTNFGDAQNHALASTDGKAFLMPHSGHPGSNRLECLILEAKPQVARISGYAPALLGPDHRHLFTAQGIFKLDGTPVEKTPKAALLLPATSGDYYLAAAVNSSPTNGQPAIAEVSAYVVGDDRPLAAIPSIDFDALRRAQDPVLTVGKRILFVPEAKHIITVPAGNNRLVFHRLDVQELAGKAQ